MRASVLAVLVLPLAMAACGDPPPTTANVSSDAAGVPAGSIGGIGAPAQTAANAEGLPVVEPSPVPELQPMRYDEFAEMKLLGSGCTFHASADAPPILLLRDEGDGLVKYRRALRRIAAPTPNRDAVMAGGIASGDGVSFQISHPPGEGTQSGDSTRDWPATMTMRMSDGGQRIWNDGVWRCGS